MNIRSFLFSLALLSVTAMPVMAQPAAVKTDIPKINEADLKDPDEPIVVTPAKAKTTDATEIEALRISLDTPTVLRLDRDAVNVLVGSNENLRVVPDTNKSIILIPKKPGTTYFQAIDADGKIIMQRHVIVGSPKSEYIRVRRACVNGATGCQQYSVYYCPDICHEVSMGQAASGAASAIPEQTPGSTPPVAPTNAAPVAAPVAGNAAQTAPAAQPLANTLPSGQ